MTQANTDFGTVANDLQRAAVSFAALTSAASLFGRSLGAFRDFERQLTLTNAIANGTVDQFNRMADAARAFSLVTTVSAVEAGQALQNLAQAGFTAEESLQAMNGVLLLSQATLSDVGLAADTLSSNIRAFGLNASDTTRVANVFAAAITSSLATIDKLAFAFRQVAPVAELAGLSIEETTAALGVLFNVGLRGEQAGTALRNIIIRLVRPLGEASDLLDQAGIATRTTTGELRNLADILRDIAASDLTDADLARIFETEALAGVRAFIAALEDVDETGSDAFERLRDDITNTDRALEISAKNLDTFDGQVKLLVNSITDFGIEVGAQLADPLREVGEVVRGLFDSFRQLEPELRQSIATKAALGAAALSLLAVINALLLVLRGPLLSAIRLLLTLIGGPLLRGIGSASAALALWVTRLGAAGAATASFTGVLTGLVAGTRAATLALGAFLATPVGAGIALITAGIAALGLAFREVTRDAREAEAAMREVFQQEFNVAAGNARSLADELIPEGEIREIENRINQLGNQLLSLSQNRNAADVTGTTNRKLIEIGGLQRAIQESVDDLNTAFSDVADLRRTNDALFADYQSAIDEFGENSREADDASDALQAFIDTLTPQEAARTEELRRRIQAAEGQIDELAVIAGDFIQNQENAISNLLTLVGRGEDTGLPPEFDLAVTALAGRLDVGPAAISQLTDVIVERARNENRDVNLIALEEALRSVGFTTADLVRIFATYQEEQVNQLAGALDANLASDVGLYDEAYARLLQREIDTATSVEDAVRAATELANIELQADLLELAGDQREQYDETFGQFGELRNSAILDAIQAAAAEVGFENGDINLANLVSGQALAEAIAAEVTADTSPEQIEAIAEAQAERFREVMRLFASLIADAPNAVTGEDLAAIQSAFQSRVAAILSSAEAGVADVEAAIEGTAQSTTSRLNRRSGGSSRDPAREALQDARKIEDAYARAARTANSAREAFAENIAGLDPNVRIELLLDVDLERATLEADRRITQIQRQIEDLRLDGRLSADLEANLNRTIELIELEKQANIDAATSFEAQMERRSQALDTFIRDLETAAITSENAFDQVAAGIGVAFAEFQRDLVTLVDITSNAVSGFLDGISSGIADFIFDNENAWENFKNTILDISREIFEGFTDALIQQAISSVTGGGGSLFGNLGLPSNGDVGGGNSQAPSVGTDGILSGLFGGGQQADGQINSAPIQQGVNQIAQTLTQGAGQIQQALSTVGTQTQAGGQQVSNSLRQTSAQVQPAGQQTAQALQNAGLQIGDAANQAASTIAASGSATGGGSNFLTQALSFGLSFFKNGGLAGGGTTHNHIRQYADGGSVVGPGTSTSDSILAMLSNGEFVVNARSTREFQPLLEAINSGALRGEAARDVLSVFRGRNEPADPRDRLRELFGSLPQFAEGGLVGSTSFGPPAVNLTEPRTVLLQNGTGQTSSNTTNNNVRGGDTLNIRVVQNVSGNQSSNEARRSADQLAKRLANQIERAKKNA